MEGLLVGVFGSEAGTKNALESSLGKKSEAEGTIIFHRTDSGKRLSLLDTHSSRRGSRGTEGSRR